MRACEPRKAACTRPTELLVLTVGIRSVGESDRYPVAIVIRNAAYAHYWWIPLSDEI